MKLRNSLPVLLAALCLVGAAPRKASAPPASSEIPKIEFEKYTLPNGLQVILHGVRETNLGEIVLIDVEGKPVDGAGGGGGR